jgi:alginate O-acetyltransferase complex protein AlgI
MLTMLLGGLWHGASWSFLLWGGLHGALLVTNRVWAMTPLRQRLASLTGVPALLWRSACVVLTFHCVCLAWCFFRLTVWSESLVCVKKWFVFQADKMFVGATADASLWLLLAVYGLAALLAHRMGRLDDVVAGAVPAWRTPLARGFVWGFAATLLLLAVLLSPGGEKPPFIYFQF